MNEQRVEKMPSKGLFLKGTDTTFIKCIITSSVVVICLLCFLFCGLISKNQLDIDFNVTFNGLQLLIMLGGNGVRQEYFEFIESEVDVTYPMTICYMALIGTVLLVALLTVFILRYTKWREVKGMRKAAGYGSIAVGGIFLLVYIIFLFDKTEVFNYFGDGKAFYNLFEMKPTMLVISLLLCVNGLIELRLDDKAVPKVKKFLPIYGFMVVPLILIFIFNIYPIVLQTVLAFKDFNLSDGVWGSKWIGFQQFKLIFTDSKMLEVIGRTLYISVLRLITGMLPSLILAICLYDLANVRLRGALQSIVYIPHFFSWVVIYAITYSLLSPQGLINTVFGGTKDYMVSEKWFMPIVIITSIWKEMGWGTILYLAALSGVDTSLFEAAKIDGAMPLQRIWHITLPSIKNTIIFLMIMNLGNILKAAGGEQLLLFYSAPTKDQALVIDTWLVWYGMNKLQYSLGAAMSFFQALIGMIMVLGCNWISKKTCGVTMW